MIGDVVPRSILQAGNPFAVALAVALFVAGCAAKRPPPEPPPVAAPTLLDFEATAYTVEGKTASGGHTREGVCAADPKVLPIGSRIRLHDAGEYSRECVIEDTGRTIDGREIDVYVPNDGEAKRFGRKKIKVEILKGPPPAPIGASPS